MATPNVGILTTAGKALIDKVNSGQAKISFSKIVFSSMDNSQLSDMQVKDLTAIAPQEVVVSSPETTLDTNSGETRIRATGTNEKLADGVYVKTYGVFAKDDTGSEILYGVTVSPNPNYFPAYDGVTPQAVTYSYKTVIQETSNITMTNSNDVYASQEDLTEAIAAIPQPDLSDYATNRQLATKANDSKVVHKTGDEEISGSKTFDTAPIDKTTGNPYITKSNLNNGLSTKVTDNKNGTEQLNGTKVQPFNKLSDTIGGRNLLIGTHSAWQPFTSTQYAIESLYITDSDKINEIIGTTVTVSAELLNCSQNCNVQIWYYDKNNGNARTNIAGGIHTYTENGKVTGIYNVPSSISASKFEFVLAGEVSGGVTGSYMHEQLEQGSIATDWSPAPEDKVNVADMRKPASDVAGIEEVNAKQDKIGYTPADDSKVAHLSGANNFDTVPTVNNNPLLLASSLPSDLARTGSDQEFKGKNTFDTAPIDKATGNPYITKDGVPAVPSTLADTTKDTNFTGKLQKSGIDVATKSDITTAVSTATANMVDSTKATNFTAGLQSGGVDVATAADLKSVADKAWRRLDFEPDANLGGALVSSYIVYQIHADEKYLSFFYLGVSQSESKAFSDGTTLMDLSSIVKGISSIDFSTSFAEISDSVSGASSFQISGTKIITSTSSHKIYVSPKTTVSLYPLNHNDRRIYYTELV